ncbi:BrnA antitoxin family protein [Pinisolibacter aquiterrae]|uniref:BrnA antitoxin family protein n=1 Tax=Pinisolibacter aquiterrae TaxID=2815579 RepID=UPI001C3D9B3A|nr:BrnA antitoxin family protein [Pinisolibacter aquiterrae]MBV5265167.1 BrnA antitoxin family protein [Pinisolibacter aquiterrae]MCC8235503.1 BrnA antitoxin family protein [Pinisolibacter aquiterrae]
MSEERIVRYTIQEIREKRAKGELKSQTDWARVDALTDADIEAAMRADPDWQDDLDPDWENAVLVIPPSKTPISIRLDDDVLSFFKAGGAGYQKRINAVLRSYMTHTRKRRAKRKPDAAE